MIPRPRSRAGQGAGFLVLETGGRHIGDIAGLAGLVAPDIAVVLNAGGPTSASSGRARPSPGSARSAGAGEGVEGGDGLPFGRCASDRAQGGVIAQQQAGMADQRGSAGALGRRMSEIAGERPMCR